MTTTDGIKMAASVIDEKEESVVEGFRQSLLEVVEERHRTLNKV